MATLAASFLFLPQLARAQGSSYSGLVYTGGDYKNPYNDPTNPRVPDASDSNGGWGGSTGAGYGSGPGSNQSFSGASDCGAGPIKAVFTWTHANTSQDDQNDPPPPVIVTEKTQSGWSATGPGAAAASGTFSNPYSFPPVTDPSGYGSSEAGTHYSTQPGAHSITVSGDLTASASGPGSGPGSGVSTASDYVNYNVTVSPVTLTLNGILRDSNTGQPILDSSGNQQILIGQGCGASVSNIPSGGGWSATYQWSVGGTTFQDWQPASASNSQASFYDPGPGVQTNPTYHWFWNDLGPNPTPETVTCTIMVTPPAGQGSSFSITATQKVTVYVPALSMLDNQVGMGYIRNTQQNNVTTSELIALHPGDPPAGNGSIWTAAVSLPATPYFGSGTWAYLQLIKAGEYLASPGQKYTSGDTLKGEGLDGPFPHLNNSYSADGRKDTSGDFPYISGLNSTIKNAVMTSSFHTYLMFQPLGNDVRWVPLAVSLWTTDFNASLDPYNNSPYSAWTDFPATQSVGQVRLGYNFVSQNSFPSWTQIIDASNDPFIRQ